MAKRKNNPKSRSITNQASSTVKREVHVTSLSAYSGIYPPPDMLIKFNQVYPDCAKDIVSMAKSEQEDRHRKENKVIDSNISNARLGITFAFILNLTIIVGCFILAYVTSVWEFLIFALVDIVILIVNKFYESNKREKQLARLKENVIPPDPPINTPTDKQIIDAEPTISKK